MRRLAITASIAASVIAFVMPASGVGAGKGCDNVRIDHLAAKELRLKGGLDCEIAKSVLRNYLRKVIESEPRGCSRRRFTQGCRVGDFTCFARRAEDGIPGRCGEGRLRVKFVEVVRAPMGGP